MNIVPQNQNNNQESPFDQIKHIDENGKEYWLARELMKFFAYQKWQHFNKNVKKAATVLENTGNLVREHILPRSVLLTKGAKKAALDYKLSRYACYLVAMNGDPNKPEIAQAQSYFAVKTREAEVVIPQQDNELEKLKIQLELEKAKTKRIQLENESKDKDDAFIQLHGKELYLIREGKADQLVPVKQETIEVIDNRNGTRYSGQTLVQIKNYLNKTHGFNIKSGAEVERILDAIGESGAIGSIPRTVLAKYIPEENLEECVPKIIEYLQQNRQLLIGE